MSTRRERQSLTFEQKPNDVELVRAAEAKRERKRSRSEGFAMTECRKKAR